MIKGDDFDLIIRNATIIDGTRMPRYAGSIGVRASKIADIGALDDARAHSELDASGQIAAPGFIDAHTHDDRLLLSGPDMAPKASQGVTTVITGNCGISLPYATASGGKVVARSICSTPAEAGLRIQASPLIARL